jgi:hypothetical protein
MTTAPADPVLMSALADPLDRIADKARVLAAAGYARADIARFLDRSYQQVRQILEQDAARRRREAAAPVPAASPPVVGGVSEGAQAAFVRTDLPVRLVAGADGSLVLPPELGAKPGEVFMACRTETGFEVIDAQTSMRRAQELIRPFIKDDGRSVVDDFIAERRLEAAREREEAQADSSKV